MKKISQQLTEAGEDLDLGLEIELEEISGQSMPNILLRFSGNVKEFSITPEKAVQLAENLNRMSLRAWVISEDGAKAESVEI